MYRGALAIFHGNPLQRKTVDRRIGHAVSLHAKTDKDGRLVLRRAIWVAAALKSPSASAIVDAPLADGVVATDLARHLRSSRGDQDTIGVKYPSRPSRSPATQQSQAFWTTVTASTYPLLLPFFAFKPDVWILPGGMDLLYFPYFPSSGRQLGNWRSRPA